MASDADFDLMLKTISSRPRMYCSTIETGRDLIFFLQGACCGAIFPVLGRKSGGEKDVLAFRDYVYRHFNREPPFPGYFQEGEFAGLLLEEFGEKPFSDVCMAVGNLFRGIRNDADDQKSTPA